jgi:hypothetical protein
MRSRARSQSTARSWAGSAKPGPALRVIGALCRSSKLRQAISSATQRLALGLERRVDEPLAEPFAEFLAPQLPWRLAFAYVGHRASPFAGV